MAGYLKALAVFRLISEQADPKARGWWVGNSFCLESRFDADALSRFFLDEYVPTPIAAPWHAKSGFGEDEETEGFRTILKSDSPRLHEYRQAITEIMTWPEFGGPVMCLRELMNLQQSAIDSLKPGKGKNTAVQKLSEVSKALDAAGYDHGLAAKWTTEQVPTSDKRLVKAVKKLRTAVKAKRRKSIDKRMWQHSAIDSVIKQLIGSIALRSCAMPILSIIRPFSEQAATMGTRNSRQPSWLTLVRLVR